MTLHHCFFECICVPFSDINGGVVPRACIDSDADLPDLLRHRRYPEFRACDDASVAITRAKKAFFARVIATEASSHALNSG